MHTQSKIALLILSTFYTQLYCASDNIVKTVLETPQRSAVQNGGPTPGHLVSKKQAEILTKERFSAVLGEKVVNLWDINWQVFTDPTLEFDAPERRNQLRILLEKIKKIPGYRDNEKFSSLHISLVHIKDDMEAVHAERLDILSIDYFKKLYPHAIKVESLDKLDGVQLGERIKITFTEENTLLYHVKTHSDGRLSEKSTAPKLVNPQELLAYKILELLGFGCEVHFFEKSPVDVYIATLDASFITRDKKCEFNVFHKGTGRLNYTGNASLGSRIDEDEAYGQRIWGTLNTVIKSIRKDLHDTNWSLVEDGIKTDEVAANFMNQQTTLDIMTRIMRLSDLLNNPKNFGFISCEDTAPQLKVIDFRVMDPKELLLEDGDFRGFLVGNGLYDYASSHKTMAYTLRYRAREKRVPHAFHIMNEKLQNVQTVVQQAHKFVLDYLNKPVFSSVSEELAEKLKIYAQAISENAQFFKAELEAWSPEKDQQREEYRQRMINSVKEN